MSQPRYSISDRHLDVLVAETQMTLPALATALEAQLDAKPELGLFLNATDSLIRLGGVDLHGDILIRPSNDENAGSLLVAYRQGDRATLATLKAATATIWQLSNCPPSATEGLGLFNFVRFDAILGPYERIEFADRAQEDAFCCRDFKALIALRRKLTELNERASRPHDLVGILWEDFNYKDHLAETNAQTPHTVMHHGEKVSVGLRKRINTRRGSSLTLHFTLRANRRVCVICALTERPNA